ncbi:DUF982 domain-containing protein [Kaistia terrae]|uniref:DUF982 domain-containing protein n=1 Tax=Kaistia terrae TaxID=537017 RepID=A0ABW0Q2R3_9HYPH|nr:DUF982 domain-containing protein [Kaistia terrae]MCX5581592.1 DUF982 domain-containing protein [Kaistia terrae]
MTRIFKPVFVWVGAGSRQAIGDVERAAEWLVYRWPEPFKSSDLHRMAKLACLAALEDKADTEAARAAFVLAAEEADILAPDNVRPTPQTDQPPRRGRRRV